MLSGFAAIIGKPNVGKSTLLNALIKEKIAITSAKAQTTRNSIIGIYNDSDLQIIFCDTPGIHRPKTVLESYMNKTAFNQADGADVIYYLVDAQSPFTDSDTKIIKTLKSYQIPLFLLINKIDLISKEALIKKINYAAAHYDFTEIIPLSALNADNLQELLKTTAAYFHDDILYYPPDLKTASGLEFRIAETVREKVLTLLKAEVPQEIACKVDQLRLTEKRCYLEVIICCARKGQKAIVIGHNGQMLAKINQLASVDLQKLIGKKVFLSLFVKVETDWLNKDRKLQDLGYYLRAKDEC